MILQYIHVTENSARNKDMSTGTNIRLHCAIIRVLVNHGAFVTPLSIQYVHHGLSLNVTRTAVQNAVIHLDSTQPFLTITNSGVHLHRGAVRDFWNWVNQNCGKATVSVVRPVVDKL